MSIASASNASHTLPAIDSLQRLLELPKVVDKTAFKVLALDLDNVIICNNSIIASRHWEHKVSFYPSSVFIRNYFHLHAPKRLVEEDSLLQNVISTYREEGWEVVILTSRHIGAKELVIAMLAQLHIPIPPENLIMATEMGRQKKSFTFLHWWKAHPQFSDEQKVHLRFTDDYPNFVMNMLDLNIVKGFTVEAFHFTKLVPAPPYTESQLQQTLIQYYCYQKRVPLPALDDPVDPNLLQTAMKTCNIVLLNEDILFILL